MKKSLKILKIIKKKTLSPFISIKEKYKHGLKVVLYRDFKRKNILKTKPIINTNNKKCEIHVLTSSKDCLNLIWALKSFYYFSKKNYSLCIHEDGSLSGKEINNLEKHFPNARIIRRAEAESKILPSLKEKYPLSYEIRKDYIISVKEFDFLHYLETDKMLAFDSDILFFDNPKFLIDKIEDDSYKKNIFNRDIETAYSISPKDIKKSIGLEVIEKFNSGLGLLHKESLKWNWIEEFLKIPNFFGHNWRFEQTLMCLCSSRWGVELLPNEYDVTLKKGINNKPCKHYVGEIRHMMYKEGMKELIKNNFIKNLR